MFGFDPELIEGFWLSFLRTGSAILLMPVFGYRVIPTQLKVALALVLAIIIAPSATANMVAPAPGVLGIVSIAVTEVLTGLLFGLVTFLVLIGAQFAGSIIGVQMGFAMLNILDLVTGQQTSLIGRLHYLLAMAIFLILDIHHHFLAALIETFRLIPLGGVIFTEKIAMSYARMTADLFMVAVKLAAPIMAMLIINETAFGFIARAVPQMNIFFVGLPVKIGVGLIGMSITLPLFVYVLSKIFNRFEFQLMSLIRLGGG